MKNGASMTRPRTELDSLLERVREDKRDTTGKNRNTVAYDCWRMFEDVAARVAELESQRAELLKAVEALRDAQAAFMVAVQTQALQRTETNSHHAEHAFNLHEPAMQLAEKVRYFGATRGL